MLDFEKHIDLTSHPGSTRWLDLFVEDPVLGITMRPNIRLSRESLGFSFATGSCGLRGPDNKNASTVIAGTSFALGVGVDEGFNWWECIGEKRHDLFNIGFPSDASAALIRLKRLYSGNYEHLVFIYHPNLWALAKSFSAFRESGVGVMKANGWVGSSGRSVLTSIREKVRNSVKKRKNILVERVMEDCVYRFNSRYVMINNDFLVSGVSRELELFSYMFSMFKRVTVIRVPVKEQVFFTNCGSVSDKKIFQKLCDQYEGLWYNFNKALSPYSVVDLTREFVIQHFLPLDTHWSRHGNVHFSRLFLECTS